MSFESISAFCSSKCMGRVFDELTLRKEYRDFHHALKRTGPPVQRVYGYITYYFNQDRERDTKAKSFDKELEPFVHPKNKAIFDCIDETTLDLITLGAHRYLNWVGELHYILRKRYRKTFDFQQYEREINVLQIAPKDDTWPPKPRVDAAGQVIAGPFALRALRSFARYSPHNRVAAPGASELLQMLDAYVEEYDRFVGVK
ncbi:MAG: hypothetical protein Q9218_002567 [Villophora microphyllina]